MTKLTPYALKLLEKQKHAKEPEKVDKEALRKTLCSLEHDGGRTSDEGEIVPIQPLCSGNKARTMHDPRRFG